MSSVQDNMDVDVQHTPILPAEEVREKSPADNVDVDVVQTPILPAEEVTEKSPADKDKSADELATTDVIDSSDSSSLSKTSQTDTKLPQQGTHENPEHKEENEEDREVPEHDKQDNSSDAQVPAAVSDAKPLDHIEEASSNGEVPENDRQERESNDAEVPAAVSDSKPPEKIVETSSNVKDGKVPENETSSIVEVGKVPQNDKQEPQSCDAEVPAAASNPSRDNSSETFKDVQVSGHSNTGRDQHCVKVSKYETDSFGQHVQEDPSEQGEKTFASFDCLGNLIIPIKKERHSSSSSESQQSEFINVVDEAPFDPLISGKKLDEFSSNGVPFRRYSINGDNSSISPVPSSGSESSASNTVEPCPSALFKVRNSTDKKVAAAIRSNEPTVFMGRSRYYKYLYRDVESYGRLAMQNKLAVTSIQAILNKVFSFSPATKQELTFARQHLETLFGDELVYDHTDLSLTESESESESDSDSIEIIGEHEPPLREDRASRTVPACFQAGSSEHSGEICKNGKVPSVCTLFSSSPPADNSPNKQPSSENSPDKQPRQSQAKTAIGIPVTGIGEQIQRFIPDALNTNLNTSMPHRFIPGSDPQRPSFIGHFSFTDISDKDSRTIYLEIHRPNSIGKTVSLLFTNLSKFGFITSSPII